LILVIFDDSEMDHKRGLLPQFCRNWTIIEQSQRKNISMLHLSTGIATRNKVDATAERGAPNGTKWGRE
jgi:hypothetical protein